MSFLFAPRPAPIASLAEADARFAACPEVEPFERALWCGARADRLGYAFAAGYRAALLRQLPGAPARASLAVTETGGGHPRAIATELRDGRLHGTKTFATLASAADALYVLARDGERLVLARVAPDAPGLGIADRPPLPFAPEIPHAHVTLDGVPCDVLPGDGFRDHVRPFRTTEDLHVLAAVLAHVAATFPSEPAEVATALLAALRAIAPLPHEPAAAITLAGAFTVVRTTLVAASPDEAEARARWERDRPLLAVAESVRAQRTAKAWAALRPVDAAQPGEAVKPPGR